MSKLVIIAKYNECINWVQDLNCDYLIYNKGKEDNRNYKDIPNIGREAETYLRYIVESYPDFPDYIILTQGDPFHHMGDYINVVNSFTNTKQLIYLSDWIHVENNSQELIWGNEFLTKLNIPNRDTTRFATGAQYIVPKMFILNKSLDFWKLSYDLLNTHNDSPWIFERIWPFIFEYNE